MKNKTITNLRFPLMLGVVLIHNAIIEPTDACAKGMEGLALIIELFSRQLAAPCVPLFFFISGFLFFLRYGENFTIVDYKLQIKKRIRSLLIPYIIWNAIVLAMFAMMHQFIPTLINSDFNHVQNYSLLQWVKSFWNYPGGQPICYQFWFLRNLLVMVLFSPAFYVFAKYSRWYIVCILCILHIAFPTFVSQQSSVFYFFLGAYFGIHHLDFAGFSEKIIKIALPIYILVLTYCTLCYVDMGGRREVLVMTGMISYIWLASKCKECNNKYADSGFFVYAFHGLPIIMLGKIAIIVVNPSGTWTWLTTYVACYVIMIVSSIALYMLIKKMFPKISSILNGGR